MKDLADRLRHASVDPSAGYFGTLCGFALSEIESLRAQVATLAALEEQVEKADAWARELLTAANNWEFQVLTLSGELARVKALVEGAPVEWRRYKECRTGLIYNDRHSISGEYELIELIARPNLNLEQKP